MGCRWKAGAEGIEKLREEVRHFVGIENMFDFQANMIKV